MPDTTIQGKRIRLLNAKGLIKLIKFPILSFYHRRYDDGIGIDWSDGHKGILHSGYSGE